LYRQSLKRLLPLLFASAFVSALPLLLQAMRGEPLITNAKPDLAALFVQVLVAIAVQYFVIAIFHNTHAIAVGKPVSIQDSLAVAKTKIWRIIVAFVIYMAAFSVGLVAFVIPGIFVAILLVFYAPLIIFDDVGIMDSFKESAGLVWGNWWRTVGVIFVPGLIILFASLLLSFPLAKFPFAFWAASVAMNALLALLIYCAVLVQFNNLKLIKSMKAPQVESKL